MRKLGKKGQSQVGIAMFIGMFITVIVGLTLLQASASNVGTVTNTITAPNTTQFTTAAAGSSVDITGQDLIGTATFYNATGVGAGVVTINAANFTVQEEVSTTTGVKTITVTTVATSEYGGQLINVTYEYGADGYADDSGARSLASLIIIFFALAVLVVVLVPSMRQKIFDF